MQDDFEKKDSFEQKVKASLDESAANLDIETRKRLTAARYTALNTQTQHAKPARWLALPGWLPSTSLVFGVLLALFFAAQYQQQSRVEFGQDQVAVFEMLNNTDDLDTLADPDFYLWADEQLATDGDSTI